ALRRRGREFDNLASRGRKARARGALWPGPGRAALINDAVDPSANILRNVKRPVRSDRKAGWAVCSAFGSLLCSRKTVGEDLAIARWVLAVQRLKNYVVAPLRIWSAVP